MPQPLKRNGSIHGIIFGPGKILERAELAAHIANVISDWRNVEETLELTYGKILRASISKNRQSHGVTDILSQQIFDSIYTLDTKLKLIDRALKVLDDTTHHETFVKLRPEIRKRGQERNNLVHNTWGVCEAYPEALILNSFDDGLMIYTIKDFVDISTRTQLVARKLLALFSKLPDSRSRRKG